MTGMCHIKSPSKPHYSGLVQVRVEHKRQTREAPFLSCPLLPGREGEKVPGPELTSLQVSFPI